jgi:hypothetical protein
MSKRKRRLAKGRAGDRPARAVRHARWTRALLVAPLVLCVLVAGAASLRWGNVRRAVGLAPLTEPQTTPTPPPLAKEYIYAGGRLVATEEPAPPSGPPPTGLAATASTAAANQIDLRWDQPSAGTVDHYEIGRKSRVGDQFSVVGSTQGAATTFADLGDPDTAYLYAVRAVFAGGARSDYSNADLATTVAFTDDPLIGANDPQGRPATTIKAAHLTELRRAVSAVHALAGLGEVTTWSYPDPVSSPASSRRPIYLEDINNLRDRLDEALPPLGRTPPTYDGLTRYVTKVSKEHFQQLRDAVK